MSETIAYETSTGMRVVAHRNHDAVHSAVSQKSTNSFHVAALPQSLSIEKLIEPIVVYNRVQQKDVTTAMRCRHAVLLNEVQLQMSHNSTAPPPTGQVRKTQAHHRLMGVQCGELQGSSGLFQETSRRHKRATIGSHDRLTILGKAPAILTQPSLHSGLMKHERGAKEVRCRPFRSSVHANRRQHGLT